MLPMVLRGRKIQAVGASWNGGAGLSGCHKQYDWLIDQCHKVQENQAVEAWHVQSRNHRSKVEMREYFGSTRGIGNNRSITTSDPSHKKCRRASYPLYCYLIFGNDWREQQENVSAQVAVLQNLLVAATPAHAGLPCWKAAVTSVLMAHGLSHPGKRVRKVSGPGRTKRRLAEGMSVELASNVVPSWPEHDIKMLI
jgi:hypothetical protein